MDVSVEAQTKVTDAAEVPTHIAIIMDGNGRWAKRRHLPRAMGHRAGADAVRKVVTACAELGVRYLTLYAFSSENWKRSHEEVSDLMGLLRLYIRNEVKDLAKNGIRLKCIGDRSRLAPDIQDMIDAAEAETAAGTNLTLVLALSYGSRAEIVNAARALAEQVKAGALDPEEISEEMIASHLYTSEIPDPDLVIRTSGEQRLSNFLMWQAAYAEFLFDDTLWPDFDRSNLEAALADFHKRERRFGGRP